MTTPTCYLPLLLLLLLLPHLVTPIKRCFKSPCVNPVLDSNVCIELCPSDDYYCQAIITLTNNIAILGCVPGSTNDTSCDLQVQGPIRSCDCSDDLCNIVANVTTPVENRLGIDHLQPDGPAPSISEF